MYIREWRREKCEEKDERKRASSVSRKNVLVEKGDIIGSGCFALV